MREIIPAIGATSLGIVIGYLVRYFIRRFEKFAPSTLGSVVSILAGGAVVKFLGADKTAAWFYPIGLLAGFAYYHRLVVNHAKMLGKRAGSDFIVEVMCETSEDEAPPRD